MYLLKPALHGDIDPKILVSRSKQPKYLLLGKCNEAEATSQIVIIFLSSHLICRRADPEGISASHAAMHVK